MYMESLGLHNNAILLCSGDLEVESGVEGS